MIDDTCQANNLPLTLKVDLCHRPEQGEPHPSWWGQRRGHRQQPARVAERCHVQDRHRCPQWGNREEQTRAGEIDCPEVCVWSLGPVILVPVLFFWGQTTGQITKVDVMPWRWSCCKPKNNVIIWCGSVRKVMELSGSNNKVVCYNQYIIAINTCLNLKVSILIGNKSSNASSARRQMMRNSERNLSEPRKWVSWVSLLLWFPPDLSLSEFILVTFSI